jgi:hypothetical protein
MARKPHDEVSFFERITTSALVTVQCHFRTNVTALKRRTL